MGTRRIRIPIYNVFSFPILYDEYFRKESLSCVSVDFSAFIVEKFVLRPLKILELQVLTDNLSLDGDVRKHNFCNSLQI